MFGKHRKTMSVSDKYVMAAGMKAGNLRPPMKHDPSTKTGPVVNKAGVKGRNNIGALGKAK